MGAAIIYSKVNATFAVGLFRVLRSLYSLVLTAQVPEFLSPKPVVFVSVTAAQAEDVLLGRSLVTLNWTLPIENENIGGELIGEADGLAQVLETLYDFMGTGYCIYEASGIGTIITTTLMQDSIKGDKILVVSAATGISVGSWLELKEGSDVEYFKVASVNGNNVVLTTRILNSTGYSTVCTVTVVDSMVAKVQDTDYTVDTSIGVVSLIAGRFTAGNNVVVSYAPDLQDLGHLEAYRVPGNAPIADPTYDNVTAHPDVEVVSITILSTSQTVSDTLADVNNGETWTFYVFCMDDEDVPNASYSASILVETFPSIPQTATTVTRPKEVAIYWDQLPSLSDVNTNGWNLYRCDGSSFIAANAKKINSVLLTSPSFEDSDDNTTNRVSSASVPYPINGALYSYKIESEDTETSWVTGTQNTSSGMTQNLIASK